MNSVSHDVSGPTPRLLTVREFLRHGAYAAFSTRLGGVSPPPYDSLNLGGSVGDLAENVEANRRLFWEAAGLDGGMAVRAQQVHSNVVAVVARRHAGGAVAGVDGLVTREPGLPLVASFADCTPVFVFDPVTKSGGIAHAGWRGTVARIAAEVVRVMKYEFGARPEDCLAAIGPSIGPCCYDVGEDVIAAVEAAFPWARAVLRERADGSGRPAWRLDLWESNRRVLVESGLREENISCCGLCTASRPDLFFSYRRDGPKSGRMVGVFVIRESVEGAQESSSP